MKKVITAIDIELSEAKTQGVAYYRIDAHFRDFLKKCNQKHGIVGFVFEHGSFNFGVVLKKKQDKEPPQAYL
ncbi:MAG: hypothetical protein UT61_C0062G0007 [Candidatus Woesebacteria bacterium GW2011_GWA1_39_8]|uniref:Uncharacterized protein n=1 Tax=Candidatus Woesebacteria bacterium GW2011_GWA1_39_8 TaxID=1618552 RepID=A0A0G0SQK9_9BACT|nr:MAG: hypothetical protein UT61_C0062G0007 [Candidatus Woesebacteria bacterium GW2011_GWA1_39_8]